MSTEQENGTKVQEKKEQVAEVTEKLENLAVDTTNEANETRPERQARGPRAARGRGRGRGGRTGGNRFQPRPPYDEQVKQIEEELATKKVLETGVKGFVKWFSVRGRYGFVAREKAADEKEDFFVHQTAITKSSTIKYYLRTLDDEEPVVFDIVEGRKGPEAANVTGPDGENVRGSRFARQLLSRALAARRGAPKAAGDRKPHDAAADGEKNVEESGDGETRGKRRPRRARGKLQPTDENGEQKENGAEEKGDGDAAGEKKPRRNRNKNKKEKSGEPAEEPKQEAAAAAPAQA